MSSSSINPQIFPSSYGSKQHSHNARVGVIVAIIAIILGLAYWAIASKRQVLVPPMNIETAAERDARIRAEQIAAMMNAPRPPLSAEEQKIRDAQIKTVTTKKTTQLTPEQQAIRDQQIQQFNEQ